MVSDIVIIAAVIMAGLTLPVIAVIGVAGWYIVDNRRQAEQLYREQLHDAEITNRESLRTQRALAANGQNAPQGGGLDLMQLASMFAPLLLKNGVPPAQQPQQEQIQYGKEIH